MSLAQSQSDERHLFLPAASLQKRLEAKRYKEKWAASAVKGIAEQNDRVMCDGGFRVPSAAGSTEAWQDLAPVETEVVRAPEFESDRGPRPLFEETLLCCANLDTLTAALEIGDACALNFANGEVPGGRYRSGGRAQEEDLCRLLPQLYPALISATDNYPMNPECALLTRSLSAVRRVGTYALCPSQGEISIISAAMPCGIADRRPQGGWAGSAWAAEVTPRIAAVLRAAKHSGHANLVLGAFGCGAFGNPPRPVAAIFRDQLLSDEFRGAFGVVVFAIIDPVGTGNLRPFREELQQIFKVSVATAGGGGKTESDAKVGL